MPQSNDVSIQRTDFNVALACSKIAVLFVCNCQCERRCAACRPVAWRVRAQIRTRLQPCTDQCRRAGNRRNTAAPLLPASVGLSSSPQELDRVATGLIEALELRNSRSLDPDLLALFLDGKYVEFRDGDRLRPACIYVVVGLRRDAKSKSSPACRAPAAKISKTGKPSCATGSNVASAVSSS
jgi:mutator family transposase